MYKRKTKRGYKRILTVYEPKRGKKRKKGTPLF
jgi:hypothetical protein